MTEKERYVKERNEAIFSLDREKIETFMRKHNINTPKDDMAFWAGIYKGICCIQNAPADLVVQARAWLLERGMYPGIGFGPIH